MAGPLKGLKILDFNTLLPAQFATMTLPTIGTEVLRIVSSSRPDLAPFVPLAPPGTDLYCAIAGLGRGKRCMALNLKNPCSVNRL
jgi:alpha-methylacyl-CoA racemase